MIRRIWLISAIPLLVAACGDDDDSSAAASTTALTTTSTSTVPATTEASTTVPRTTAPPTTSSTGSVTTTLATSGADTTTPAVSCSQSPPFDPNGSLRDQFVTYLVSCGFTQSEAACLFEHLDFDDPAVLAGDPDAMLPAFETCNIDTDRMAEIGAP
jgi:hypothetical protein